MIYTAAVDFDGTFCKYAYPKIGAPKKRVIEVVHELRNLGWHIVVYTARVNYDVLEPQRTKQTWEMLIWLEEHGIPFHQVWGLEFYYAGLWGLAVRPGAWRFSTEQVGKPVANVYLDDRMVDLDNLSTNNLIEKAIRAHQDYVTGIQREANLQLAKHQ